MQHPKTCTEKLFNKIPWHCYRAPEKSASFKNKTLNIVIAFGQKVFCNDYHVLPKELSLVMSHFLHRCLSVCFFPFLSVVPQMNNRLNALTWESFCQITISHKSCVTKWRVLFHNLTPLKYQMNIFGWWNFSIQEKFRHTSCKNGSMCELLGLFGDGFHLFSKNSFDSRGAFDRRRKQIATLENWLLSRQLFFPSKC